MDKQAIIDGYFKTFDYFNRYKLNRKHKNLTELKSYYKVVSITMLSLFLIIVIIMFSFMYFDNNYIRIALAISFFTIVAPLYYNAIQTILYKFKN